MTISKKEYNECNQKPNQGKPPKTLVIQQAAGKTAINADRLQVIIEITCYNAFTSAFVQQLTAATLEEGSPKCDQLKTMIVIKSFLNIKHVKMLIS
jgi:hypothetical protein